MSSMVQQNLDGLFYLDVMKADVRPVLKRVILGQGSTSGEEAEAKRAARSASSRECAASTCPLLYSRAMPRALRWS